MTFSTVDVMRYWTFIKSIGISSAMEDYEVRKMSIFNQLNFFGIAMGFIVPIISFFALQHLPPLAWYAAGSPLAIGIIVLWLNYERYYEFARMIYFQISLMKFLAFDDQRLLIVGVFFFHQVQ